MEMDKIATEQREFYNNVEVLLKKGVGTEQISKMLAAPLAMVERCAEFIKTSGNLKETNKNLRAPNIVYKQPEVDQLFYTLYEKGYTDSKTATTTHFSPATVARWRTWKNLPPNPPLYKNRKKTPYRAVPQPQIETCPVEVIENEITLQFIMEHFCNLYKVMKLYAKQQKSKENKIKLDFLEDIQKMLQEKYNA